MFDDFWISGALEARIYLFYYTKMLQQIQEEIGNILGKSYFCKYGHQKNDVVKGTCTSFVFSIFRGSHF